MIYALGTLVYRSLFARLCFVALVYVLSGLLPTLVHAGNRPFTNSHFAEIEGLTIHYRLWEPGHEQVRGNMFMVHGFAGSSFSWEQVADSLLQLGHRQGHP